jgi:hypothetical protein
VTGVDYICLFLRRHTCKRNFDKLFVKDRLRDEIIVRATDSQYVYVDMKKDGTASEHFENYVIFSFPIKKWTTCVV